MAFTMHSHSGQFCPGHAKDQLEAIIQHAISIGYTTMGLTEHMPRTSLEDLYPEELEDPEASLAALAPRHEAYLQEARRLQVKYADKLHIIIGFEGEWLRTTYGPLILDLASHPIVDYFIGSIHHVNAVPIDFDKAYYAKAMDTAGGNEENMYERYYDEQFEMFAALEPKIVGHFDLIRLMSEDPARDVRQWSGVWDRIKRNLERVKEYDGWLECNSAALRKGLTEPYPCRIIAEEWLRIGGKFTLSDDSHGIAQVATNYTRALDYLESLGVGEVWTYERTPHPGSENGAKADLTPKSVPIGIIRNALK